MFRRVLVANRGEIAVRVIRAVHDLDMEAVAVFSEADRHALHVRLADYAYPIGPAPSSQSYLNIQAVLDAARRSRAEALHPGYGFLAESATFARACADAGVVFVGPSPEGLLLTGDKVAARQLALAAGVPIAPGTTDPVGESAAALAEAARIGYPLLVKAAAGGGGRGMRLVQSPEALSAALLQARREAESGFGDGTMYLEQWIERARHVEVQLFGDGSGKVLHLGERDCSLQRRHQKVVEEAFAPNLPHDLRQQMRGAAVAVAEAARYAGAGTVEFLYAPTTGSYYFLEMNARLQVEHTVTEQVTGVDLVQAQLRLAAGESLETALWPAGVPPSEATPFPSLHAIEARIMAEDPAHGWTPSAGRLELLREPAGPGIRVDSGCEPGQEVTTHYDSLLAKLVATGRTRQEALIHLRRALDEYVIAGVRTTVPFLRWLLRDDAFLAGEVTTDFITQRWQAHQPPAVADGSFRAAAIAAGRSRAVTPPARATAASSGTNGRVPRDSNGNYGSGSQWVLAGRREALR